MKNSIFWNVQERNFNIKIQILGEVFEYSMKHEQYYIKKNT